jgi:hypothetical protein
MIYICVNSEKMKTAELKIEIIRKIESLDSTKLKEFYGILHNFLNSKTDTDDWVGVSEIEKEGIESAISEFETGKGIPHSQVMKNFRNMSIIEQVSVS